MAQNQLRIMLRKIHKWIFIYMGIFMLFWVLSGIMISIPMYWLDVSVKHSHNKADYAAAVVSPSQAAATVLADNGAGAKVASVQMQALHGTLVYVVKVEGGDTRMIDAGSGEYFKFTPTLAEAIVRERYGIDTALVENQVMTAHNFGYPWGPLPVSHLRFEGEFANADFYVNHASGNVRSATLLTRARVAAGMIHSLEPIKFITGSERLHRAVLVLTGLVSLIGVLTGLYLVLPRRKGA